jgi:hypothetical protein
MRGVYTLIFLLAACAAHGQEPSVAPGIPASSAQTPTTQPSKTQPESPLPDSPGQILQQQQDTTTDNQESVVIVAKAAFASGGTKPPPCRTTNWLGHHPPQNLQDSGSLAPLQCVNVLNPYARFLDTSMPIPMTPRQKGYLAFRDVIDPFNLITIVGSSAVTIAIDPETAFGPGFKGFGKLSGISLLQDVTGEFFGTFLIPSLTHEDPHYHRMPTARFPRRLLHAVSRTVIAQSDYGHTMPNYATLLTYPIGAELANLYVPGLQTNGPSTAKRIFTGYAFDPIGNVVTEFLPDVAKRIHIRIIFVQQILNQVAVTPSGAP